MIHPKSLCPLRLLMLLRGGRLCPCRDHRPRHLRLLVVGVCRIVSGRVIRIRIRLGWGVVVGLGLAGRRRGEGEGVVPQGRVVLVWVGHLRHSRGGEGWWLPLLRMLRLRRRRRRKRRLKRSRTSGLV